MWRYLTNWRLRLRILSRYFSFCYYVVFALCEGKNDIQILCEVPSIRSTSETIHNSGTGTSQAAVHPERGAARPEVVEGGGKVAFEHAAAYVL